ncbi:hypothetical protein GF420_03460 [candidate division GN15 bacterium]|nr:hypothetical protein [candidate division GN15 bacterium]
MAGRLRSRRWVSVAAIGLALMALTVNTTAATFQLPAGTPVAVTFAANQPISSGDVISGVPLVITLAEPIKLGDRVLVEAGAEGKAMVTDVKKASAPGNPGMIRVEFQEIDTKGEFATTDGSSIKLTGAVEMEGKGKKTLAFITIIGILFIKGGQGEIPADSTYSAEVAETIVLTSP